MSSVARMASAICVLNFAANANLDFTIIRGRYVRAAGALKQIGDQIPRFPKLRTVDPRGPGSQHHTDDPFVPLTAVW